MYKNFFFEEAIYYAGGANAWRIWDLIGLQSSTIPVAQKFDVFKTFFVHAFKTNVMIEYSQVTKTPIFSGNPPQVVVDRIFSDFPLDKLPDMRPENENAFIVYMVPKIDGWAVIEEGTTLIIPS